MLKRLLITLVILVTVATAGIFGFRVGKLFERNAACCGIATANNVKMAVMEAAGLVAFPSQIGQDRWVAGKVFPDVRNGYFVDVGSAHGFNDSNSWLLEQRGWTGICIDPFPKNMTGRTCRLFEEAVDAVGGRTVQFTAAGGLGGITEYLGEGKNSPYTKDARTVQVITTTLADILRRANAPPFIHYINLDIEGAELEALKGFPFDKYRVGAFTIEHNYEEPKRSDIRRLLAERGYVRERAWKQDDFYVAKPKPTDAR